KKMKLQQWIMQHKNYWTAITGTLIFLARVAELFFASTLISKTLLIIASLIGVLPIFLQAYQAVKVKVISIDLLVTIAVIGAFLTGEYSESAIVTFLFLFGNFLEQKTLEKTRSAIHSLTKMAPKHAFKINSGGTIEKVDIDEVDEEDQLLVKTGSQLPVDGVIYQGEGYVDEASVTGESKLSKKNVGDRVFAGTFLDNGSLD